MSILHFNRLNFEMCYVMDHEFNFLLSPNRASFDESLALDIKSNCIQESTDSKHFEFLIPDIQKVTSETMTFQGLLSIRNTGTGEHLGSCPNPDRTSLTQLRNDVGLLKWRMTV